MNRSKRGRSAGRCSTKERLYLHESISDGGNIGKVDGGVNAHQQHAIHLGGFWVLLHIPAEENVTAQPLPRHLRHLLIPYHHWCSSINQLIQFGATIVTSLRYSKTQCKMLLPTVIPAMQGLHGAHMDMQTSPLTFKRECAAY